MTEDDPTNRNGLEEQTRPLSNESGIQALSKRRNSSPRFVLRNDGPAFPAPLAAMMLPFHERLDFKGRW